MARDEDYDADEILMEPHAETDEAEENEDEIREIKLGNQHDSNIHFRELVSDVDTPDDLWE